MSNQRLNWDKAKAAERGADAVREEKRNRSAEIDAVVDVQTNVDQQNRLQSLIDSKPFEEQFSGAHKKALSMIEFLKKNPNRAFFGDPASRIEKWEKALAVFKRTGKPPQKKRFVSATPKQVQKPRPDWMSDTKLLPKRPPGM